MNTSRPWLWEMIESLGFKRDLENDVMVLDGYGAFMQNLCSDVKCLQDLNRKDLKFSEWDNCFYDLQEEGWQLVLGPGVPEKGATAETALQYFGLYCKNYLEIAQKEK